MSTARSWSIAEVARMSGITARTLRHYDAIGLLPPAGVSASGWRRYGRAELLRLQRLLLLRELGLSLPAIAEVLAEEPAGGAGATIDALRRHEEWLVGERARLGALLATVRKTIDGMERGSEMDAEGLFEG